MLKAGIRDGRSLCRPLVPPTDSGLVPSVGTVLAPDWPFPPGHTGAVGNRRRRKNGDGEAKRTEAMGHDEGNVQ